ncbi:MAG: PIN domain-containing protein [archaeon]
MLARIKNQTRSQRIKRKARRNLSSKFSREKDNYVVDTSAIIHRFLPGLIKKGLSGRIIIPNAVMAELESQANKGFEWGFIGLDEVVNLHNLKEKYKITIFFEGIRPQENHIKYAKSGEIDALIREIARENNATLITSDLVQAKSAQAYNIPVIFLRPKLEKPKKRRFWPFGK